MKIIHQLKIDSATLTDEEKQKIESALRDVQVIPMSGFGRVCYKVSDDVTIETTGRSSGSLKDGIIDFREPITMCSEHTHSAKLMDVAAGLFGISFMD
jgi:hypothetical protein